MYHDFEPAHISGALSCKSCENPSFLRIDWSRRCHPASNFFPPPSAASPIEEPGGADCPYVNDLQSGVAALISRSLLNLRSVVASSAPSSDRLNQQIHPQHLFHSLRRTAAPSTRSIRLDSRHGMISPMIPQEFFSFGFATPCAVFRVADGLLLHLHAPPLLDTLIISAITACAYHDLISVSLTMPVLLVYSEHTISFLDFYRNTEKNIAGLSIQKFTPEVQAFLAKNLSEIAYSYGLKMDTCAEGIDLQKFGIDHARCIDDRLFGKLLHCPLKVGKDKNQRLECGCIESLDIGAYNTCKNGCRYCYANHSANAVCTNAGKHNPESPLLIGEIGPEDKITERKMHSCIENQIQFDL